MAADVILNHTLTCFYKTPLIFFNSAPISIQLVGDFGVHDKRELTQGSASAVEGKVSAFRRYHRCLRNFVFALS
jgi:hypothetical protein